jgi:hypothetical protein
VTAKTGDLVTQIGKYRSALEKCLRERFSEQPQAIECIAVLGSIPTDLTREQVDKTLAGINARVVTYDDLIANALQSYQEYLDRHEEVSRLADLIARLEASSGDAATDGGDE